MYGLIVFQEKYENAVRALGHMKESIERYEAKPDHNTKYLAIQHERLSSLVDFVKIAGQALTELEHDRSEAYSAGVKKGRELEKRNSGAVSLTHQRFFDKEGCRYDTIESARKDFPNLY
ncbi:MAG: hypothetical protein ACRBF0_19950 [Calditrichia bacterium]